MPSFNHNGINLFCEVAGEGPPLLLINGLSMDTRLWAPLVEKLKGSRRVISYDMRCVGKSDKPDQPFTIDDLADEAHGLLQHLKLEGVSVLGFSMGGMVAMSLALRHPEDVRRLILVATAPSLKRPHPPSDGITAMLRRTDVTPALLTEVYESIFGSAYKKTVSADEYVRLRMSDSETPPAYAYLRQLDALESCDLCDGVAAIAVPSVVIAGAEDRIIPPGNARWLNRRLAGSVLHLLEGVGHMVPLEAPDRLAEAALAEG